LYSSLLLLLALAVVVFALGRPPWVSKAQWHFSMYIYWMNERGVPEQREYHLTKLVACGEDAVSVIAEYAVTCPRVHDREVAIGILRRIGPLAHQAIDEMLAQPIAQIPSVSKSVQDRRLYYAQFVAFRDWNAFDQWLGAMEQFGGDWAEETILNTILTSLSGQASRKSVNNVKVDMPLTPNS